MDFLRQNQACERIPLEQHSRLGMGKQSAPGSSFLGALILIGIIGWVLSLVWMYLVIGGAIALVGWIGWTATKTLRTTSESPRLAEVQAPRMAPPPEDYYRPIIPVDAKVFGDPSLTEEAALRTFAAWTQFLPMAPADPSDLIRSLELRVKHIGRLVTEVAERRVAWREVPHSGSSRPTKPKVAAENLDPWSLSPEALRSASYHISSCGPCTGAGKIACPDCSGTTRAACSSCNGEGKAYGYAANGAYRLLNCKSCRGKGNVKCTACTKGKIICPTCNESGRSERWLEVAETIRYDVQIEPDGEMTRAFHWGTDGTPAARAEVEADAKIIVEMAGEGPLSYNDVVQRVAADWLAVNWQRIQPTLGEGERIRRQTFWLLEVPSIELSYSLAATAQTRISFEGRRMLAPPPSIDRQFAERAQRIWLVRYALIGLCVVIPIAYLLRGAYFWSGWVLGLAACAAGVALAVDGFVRHATLRRQIARRWGLGVAAGAILACGLAVAAEPSLRAAKRHVLSGELELAEIELRALGREDKAQHAQAWADLRLAQLLRSGEVEVVVRDAALIPEHSTQRTAADQHLHQLVEKSTRQILSEGKLETAEATLAVATPALERSPEGRARLAELRARVQDIRHDQCKNDDCRWRSAMDAVKASPTEVRRQRAAAARAAVVNALTFQEEPDEPMLSRLRRIRRVTSLAETLKEGGDKELVAQARAAIAWAQEERGKIPLIGAAREVVVELLGTPLDTGTGTPKTVLSKVAGYWSLHEGRCTGIYLVGDERGARVLNDNAHAHAAAQMLSQALGRKVALPAAPKQANSRSSAISKWKEGRIAIVARWRGRDLIELRIGDAIP